MTALTSLLVLVAVLLALPAPAWRRLDRAPSAAGAGAGRTSSVPRVLLVAVLVGGGLTLAAALAGPRAGVFLASGLVVVGTVLRLGRLRARRTAAERSRAAVAEACTLLAANLRVGMVPAQALTAAADTCAVLEEARQTLALGGDVTAVWRRQARRDGSAGLRELARAWQVGTRTGASLTSTLDEVARGLTADVALRAVVGSELAAPRATGKVMAALPALGLGLGYLLGGDPLRWLAASAAGWACLLAGTVLACAGVLWIETLARRAAAQG